MEDETNNQNRENGQESVQENSSPKLSFVFGAIFVILVLGLVAFKSIFGAAKNLVSVKPAEPTPTPSELVVLWQTYTNSEFGYSLKVPEEFEITPNGVNGMMFVKKSQEPGQGPTNFIYVSVVTPDFRNAEGEIYNYNSKDFSALALTEVGGRKSLVEGATPDLSSYFTYTRLEDITIDGATASAYLNSSPWEFPMGTKEYRYVIDKGDNIYVIGGYTGASDTPSYLITDDLFQEIVNSFKFLEK